MRNYIIKRLVLFLPTLLIITLVVFLLSQLIPGDPAERLSGLLSEDQIGKSEDSNLSMYERTYLQLGLDMPLFYFSVQPRAAQFNTRQIAHPGWRNTLKNLMYETGDPQAAIHYFNKSKSILSITAEQCQEYQSAHSFYEKLPYADDLNSIRKLIDLYRSTAPKPYCKSHPVMQAWEKEALKLTQMTRKSDWWIPTVSWHGSKSQYHFWINNILSGNWGYSLRDGRPVNTKITSALYFTIYLSAFSLILTFFMGIPLGLFLAISKNKSLKKVLRAAVYGFYAMPLFWLATLLVIFFTTSEYGSWTNLFPSPASTLIKTQSNYLDFLNLLYFLSLPIICMAFNGMAFVARQMEQSALREREKLYITMSKAKGNSQLITVWKYLFPNAAFPLITLLGTLLPALISGSVVIEVIFNIPGMGRLLWDSIFGQDWNTVFAILLLGGILTLIGQLLADLLYAKTDPRVSYD